LPTKPKHKRQAALFAKLNHNGPDLLHLDIDDHGGVVIDESDGEGEVTDLLAEIERAMQGLSR
jgi:hypothetical protein